MILSLSERPITESVERILSSRTDGLLSGLQVLINYAETKDGSGGPLDYEDLELEEALFPRFTEPTQHQSLILVRHWDHWSSSIM